MSTRSVTTRLADLAAIVGVTLVLSSHSFAAQGGETARVVKEACGAEPEPACVAKLQKICRGEVTFRCYYARKRRIDGPEGPDSPERADERDDRSIFYDE